MKCEKCGGHAKYVSSKSLYNRGGGLSYGIEQLYKCKSCKHKQKEVLFHSSGRDDFASFSQPEG